MFRYPCLTLCYAPYIYLYVNNSTAYTAYKTCTVENCNFSYQELSGKLYELNHGGPYTAKLVASGGGTSASDQKTFSVDRMPMVAVTNPIGVVLSPFDITGDITFKPTLSTTKGTIYLYLNNSTAYTTYKTCTTESCPFSYQQLTGKPYSLAPGGPYTVKLTATGGGATASDQKTFTVASCKDIDKDGHFGYDAVNCPMGKDCNDNDSTIHPGANEQCSLQDGNCNSEAGEGGCSCSANMDFESSLNIVIGTLEHSQDLFSTKGAGATTNLALYYNSHDPWIGSLGQGWMHSYEIALKEMSGGSVIFRNGDGKKRVYQPSGGAYVSQRGDFSTLSKEASGWKLIEKFGSTYQFNDTGKIISIADRNGNSMIFTHTMGNLTSVVDSAGRSTIFEYDAQQNLRTITDPNGNHHLFTYQGGSLTSVATEDTLLGIRTWSYTYDVNGLLLTKTDPNGNTTTYAYDSNDRVVSVTTPEGLIKIVTYSPGSSTTQVTETDGGIWTYKYDTNLGVLTQKSDPLGNTTTYTYDANRNLTSRTDPDGTVTGYSYDSQGNMISTTDALGNTTTYSHDSFGQVTSSTAPAGGVTVQAYDLKGNLTSTTDPSGAVTTYESDPKGNLTKLTNALGQITIFTYDAQYNLASITDPSGATTSFIYDISANMTSQTDVQGNTTKFDYNSLNQLTKVTDPSGNTTDYAYDANGNRILQTDANGNVTDYDYNYRGQLTAVQDAIDNVTSYGWVFRSIRPVISFHSGHQFR